MGDWKMFTEYLGPITEDNLSGAHALLERAARLIQQGALVAIPSETIYGLGVSILNTEAVQKLFAVKQRKQNHALPILIAHLDQLKFIAREIPPAFGLLSKQLLPGPLTVILKKNLQLSPLITGGKDTVAIRFSSHPALKRIVELAGCPIAFPSANLSGKPSPTLAKHVFEDFNGKIEAIVDGGETEYGLESTLISLENPDRPILYRFGVVEKRDIENVLGCELEVHPQALLPQRVAQNLQSLPAIRLFSSWDEMKIYLKLSNRSKRLIMSYEENVSIAQPGDLFKLSGKNLYEGLRFASRNGYAEVLVLCTPGLKSNEPLYRRLKQIANT